MHTHHLITFYILSGTDGIIHAHRKIITDAEHGEFQFRRVSNQYGSVLCRLNSKNFLLWIRLQNHQGRPHNPIRHGTRMNGTDRLHTSEIQITVPARVHGMSFRRSLFL
jgi:hypothetical protein